MIVAKMEMRGFFECFLKDSDGRSRFVGKFENLYTNNAKEMMLRTLLQTTGGGTKLSATAYPAKLAYCTGDYPSSPESDDIDADGGAVADTPNGYISFATLSALTVTAASCSGTKSATWTNAFGSGITVSFLACVYTTSTVASNIYNMASITDTLVGNGQSFVVNYSWQFNFDIASGPI